MKRMSATTLSPNCLLPQAVLTFLFFFTFSSLSDVHLWVSLRSRRYCSFRPPISSSRYNESTDDCLSICLPLFPSSTPSPSTSTPPGPPAPLPPRENKCWPLLITPIDLRYPVGGKSDIQTLI